MKESWEDLPTRKFDCILVSAAAASVPDKLVAKLRIDGRMVIPVKTGFDHTIRLVKKISESKLIEQNYPGFMFVPLI